MAHLGLGVLGVRLLPKMCRARPSQCEEVQVQYAGIFICWLSVQPHHRTANLPLFCVPVVYSPSWCRLLSLLECGTPEWIRTTDLLLRRQNHTGMRTCFL